MSDIHRICETCVYCSFSGNCDRYNNPLTSIEQPACGAYEIHPLLAENAKLREQLAEWKRVAESKQNIIDHMRDANAENAKLREQLDTTEHNRALNFKAYMRLYHENAKLREELAKWERLAAGIDLPEYPVTQFKPKDLERENAELQDENARLRSCLSDDAENALMIVAENTKLRELCADLYAEMIEYSDAPHYNASVWAPKLRELGIEVD